MTTTRWLIVGFWAVVFVFVAKYAVSSILAPPPAPVAERHWYPPPLPGSAPAPTAAADIRLLHYVPHVSPGAMSFTADVTVKNVGAKKATDIQVRIQPYVGTADSKTTPGPDEIPNQPGGDAMVNVTQWVDFPDLGPGESNTQTVTFPMRSDADPAQAFKPQIVFQTAKP